MPLSWCGTSFDRADIGGDVLALEAVAARGGRDQLAVLVAQRHRQPVDLRLGGERHRLVLLEVEEAADAADEIGDLLGVERVLQRQHRHRVPHLGEAARRRGADLARQALQRAQVRERLPRSPRSGGAARRTRRPTPSARPSGSRPRRAS